MAHQCSGRDCEFKKARFAANGFDARVAFIPGNYIASGVLPLLYANGFNPDSPSFFIWEGNTVSDPRSRDEGLDRPCQGVRAFSIAFDYMDEAVVACTTGDRQTTGFVQRFAAMGAPWHFGIDDLNTVAHEAGMTVVDCRTVETSIEPYWPTEILDSTIYEHYSLCTLTPR